MTTKSITRVLCSIGKPIRSDESIIQILTSDVRMHYVSVRVSVRLNVIDCPTPHYISILVTYKN